MEERQDFPHSQDDPQRITYLAKDHKSFETLNPHSVYIPSPSGTQNSLAMARKKHQPDKPANPTPYSLRPTPFDTLPTTTFRRHPLSTSKEPYDNMKAWSRLPKETQNALPKSYWQIGRTKNLQIRKPSKKETSVEEHVEATTSTKSSDEQENDWQTTTSTNSSSPASPQQPGQHEVPEGETPNDSAIDLNDFSWAPIPIPTPSPKSSNFMSSASGPRRALQILEGREMAESPVVPALFSIPPRPDSRNNGEPGSFHLTRSNVYRAAGWGKTSVEEGKEDGGGEFPAHLRGGMGMGMGNETRCVGHSRDREEREAGGEDTGSVQRILRTLRRVSRFGGV
ncbi:hypothetical protein BST61_g1469 [Cercospora zeina]